MRAAVIPLNRRGQGREWLKTVSRRRVVEPFREKLIGEIEGNRQANEASNSRASNSATAVPASAAP